MLIKSSTKQFYYSNFGKCIYWKLLRLSLYWWSPRQLFCKLNNPIRVIIVTNHHCIRATKKLCFTQKSCLFLTIINSKNCITYCNLMLLHLINLFSQGEKLEEQRCAIIDYHTNIAHTKYHVSALSFETAIQFFSLYDDIRA